MGINIAFIKREDGKIPTKNERFFSGWNYVIGSDAQVKEFDNLHQHEFDPPKMLRKLKL
jgi:hypothetical protein